MSLDRDRQSNIKKTKKSTKSHSRSNPWTAIIKSIFHSSSLGAKSSNRSLVNRSTENIENLGDDFIGVHRADAVSRSLFRSRYPPDSSSLTTHDRTHESFQPTLQSSMNTLLNHSTNKPSTFHPSSTALSSVESCASTPLNEELHHDRHNSSLSASLPSSSPLAPTASIHERLVAAHQEREECLVRKELAAQRMDYGMLKLDAHQKKNFVYQQQYHAFQHEFFKAVQSLEVAEQEIITLKDILDGGLPIPPAPGPFSTQSHSSSHPSSCPSLRTSLRSSSQSFSGSDDTHYSAPKLT